jgi:hypothetical protein
MRKMKIFQVRERINININNITIHRRNHYLCHDLIRRQIGQIQMAPIQVEHHRHHHHHHHHHNNNNHHHSTNQKQSNENFPISNYLPAFESMALNKTNEKHLDHNKNSTFDFKNNPPLNSTNNSDPPSSPSCKIICRSNSSPSYTTSSSSSISPSTVTSSFAHAPSPSYSSLLMPYNGGGGAAAATSSANLSSSASTTPTTPTNSSNANTSPSLNSSTGFIYKSNSCSLPIKSPSNNNNNNNNSSASSANPSPSTTPTAVNMNSSFDSHFTSFYSPNTLQLHQQHSLNENSMSNRNMMFSIKPPEIVITESKPENDQIDYAVESDSTKKLNSLNKKK